MSKKKSNAKTTKTTNTSAKRATSTKRSRGARSGNLVETNDDAETLGTAPDTTATMVPETTETATPETAESGETLELAEADEDAATEDDAEDAEGTERTDAPAARTRPVVPKIGTVIKKIDRYGKVRCQCKVVEGGIRYSGKVYGSLSGAAMAAAKDLGLENKTQNGFTFWGLTKPTRPITDPVAAITKSWQRYYTVATAALKAATEANCDQLRAALQEQSQTLASLLGDVGAVTEVAA